MLPFHKKYLLSQYFLSCNKIWDSPKMSDYNILRYNGKSEQFSITDPASKQQILQGQAAHPKQTHQEQKPSALVDLLQPQHLPI